MPASPADPGCVLVEGPWRHRDVTASGLKFHVAEHGPVGAPLVLLLHGFPEFWWSWRHQLVALGEAGYHAVAVDLRGYGATDKPPRGYDLVTLAGDVAALIRSLGAHDAHVVGHDWGAALGWTTATLHPSVVRRLTAVSVPHPLRFRQALLHDGHQRRLSAYMGLFQVPRVPERRLEQGDLVEELLSRWGGPGFPDAETATRCREAMTITAAAHSAMEYYRWAFRSRFRPSGHRFLKALAAGVPVPTQYLHGAQDGCISVASARGCEPWVRGPYAFHELPDVGHFPHQESPDAVTSLLLEHDPL